MVGQANFNKVQLIVGGSATGDNKATGNVTSVNTYYNFGGASQLWGLTPDDTDINGADFGVRIKFVGTGHGLNSTTYSLDLTDFDFTIPAGATIDGIQVDIKGKYVYAGFEGIVHIDHVRITVTYTEAAAAGNSQMMGANF